MKSEIPDSKAASATPPAASASKSAAPSDEEAFIAETRRRFQERKALIETEQRLETELEMQDAKSILDSRSPLDHLPPARRQLLYETLCDYSAKTVEDIVTIPESEGGWGLDTTESSLKRFKRRYEKRLHSQRQKETEHLAREILATPITAETDLDSATCRLFKTRLLDTLNDPKQSPQAIRDYLQAYTRLRALDLAERKQLNP